MATCTLTIACETPRAKPGKRRRALTKCGCSRSSTCLAPSTRSCLHETCSARICRTSMIAFCMSSFDPMWLVLVVVCIRRCGFRRFVLCRVFWFVLVVIHCIHITYMSMSTNIIPSHTYIEPRVCRSMRCGGCVSAHSNTSLFLGRSPEEQIAFRRPLIVQQ